jgi:hypothetical protein
LVSNSALESAIIGKLSESQEEEKHTTTQKRAGSCCPVCCRSPKQAIRDEDEIESEIQMKAKKIDDDDMMMMT